jgi:hypothetical protein
MAYLQKFSGKGGGERYVTYSKFFPIEIEINTYHLNAILNYSFLL